MSKVNWTITNIEFRGKVFVCAGMRPIFGLEKMHLALTTEWSKAASVFWCALTCCTFTEESDPSVSLLGCRLLSLLREKVLMEVKIFPNASAIPKMGEIDTSAPFQSVKDAVTLFGEGASLPEKPLGKQAKPLYAATEHLLEEETNQHLTLKELSVKERLKNAEITKSQALAELEKAKMTVQELTHKLQLVTKSNLMESQTSTKTLNGANHLESGSSMNHLKNGDVWQHDLYIRRETYMGTICQLDSSKQKLVELQRNFRDSLHAELGDQCAEGTVWPSDDHIEKVDEVLTDTLSSPTSSVGHNVGSVRQELAEILSPETTVQERSKLHLEMERTRLMEMDSLRSVSSELGGAKETLQKVAEEETCLRNTMESLKEEIEIVKKQHLELKEKESKSESDAGNLHVKLRKAKAELQSSITGDIKLTNASEDIIASFEQLFTESMNAKKEAEGMMEKASELKKEADGARVFLGEAERKLKIALKAAEQSKIAEAKTLDELKLLSEKTTADRLCTSELGAKVRITKDEYKLLCRKDDVYNSLTEMKLAAALAEVEVVKASEAEVLKKLEMNHNEITKIEAAREEALKRAEMANSAKRAVEGELQRWKEKEQKKAAETASRILAEAEFMPLGTSPTKCENTLNTPEKEGSAKRREKSPNPRKKLLPNLSGIFQRKKNHLDGAPSYLPGERPI